MTLVSLNNTVASSYSHNFLLMSLYDQMAVRTVVFTVVVRDEIYISDLKDKNESDPLI